MLERKQRAFLCSFVSLGFGARAKWLALGICPGAESAAGLTCRRRAEAERAGPAGQDRTYSRTCRRRVCEHVRTSCIHRVQMFVLNAKPCVCEQRLSRRQQERDLWGAFARRVRRPAARAGHPADGEVTRAVAPRRGGASAARSDADLWGGIERSA